MRLPVVTRAAYDQMVAAKDAHIAMLQAAWQQEIANVAAERARGDALQLDLRQLGERLANREQAVVRDAPLPPNLPFAVADTIDAIAGSQPDLRRHLTRKAWGAWEATRRTSDAAVLTRLCDALRFNEPFEVRG